MSTTYTQFVSNLANMTIAGVTRKYGWGNTPPASINSADIPVSWVQLPEGDHRPVTFAGGSNWGTFQADLIVVVLPTVHATLAEAFQATVTLMDAVRDALHNTRLADSRTTWTLRQGVVALGKMEYWAVLAHVTSTG